MAQQILISTVRILFLLLLKALVVSRMNLFGGLILPWVYIFGLLMLPLSMPSWGIMLSAFAVGVGMDYLSGPMGLHTSSCLVIGLVLPWMRRILAPREGYDSTQKPTVQKMGLPWYLTYAGAVTLAHHAWFFIVEVFRTSDLGYQLIKILLSSVLTLILMTIGQYLIYNSKN
ncbi:MAG: hypothetical protein ACKOSR_00125 [Flavobacteriales bacterium]